MAEAILFNATADIILKLGSFALREFGLWWGINDELDKLKHSLSAIQAVLLDAEAQQFKSFAVMAWVSRLKDVLYEIDDLMDESSYETLRRQVLAKERRNRKQVRILFKFKSNWKTAHKIRKIRQRLKAINDDKNQFSFTSQPIVIDTREGHDDGLRKRRETGSYIPEEEVIGRNDDKETVIDLLLNSETTEDIAVISIVGMGGLGKTALAQSIYNHKRMNNYQFSLKLWVCVSEDFDVKVIIRKIIESATGNIPDSSLQMDTLEKKLKSQIDGKKYLLFMDDVWNETKGKWLHLKKLLMGGAKGSRILITTQSEKVAKTFDTTFLHSLQILDPCNSWLLFQKMTGLKGPDNQEELDQNSNFIQIGKEIISRLKGVPLVIRTIGGLLKDNKSERFWLSFKDKELYQVLGQGQDDLKEMRLILELSYKYLPANLKQCFLYCALFPKDYEIQKDVLIRLWRAQGFIQTNGNNDNLIDIGDDYFMELLSRSFFQEVTKNKRGDIKSCKMHDLMHDLACLKTDNECMHGRIGNIIDKRTHHFSWKEYCGETLLKTLPTVTNLRTFFMLDDAHALQWDLEIFFHCYLRLRTLRLHFLGENPNAKFLEFIGKLKHLRFLSIMDLDIQNLPDSITELYNLETLILQKTSLVNLPSDIKSLINLKHLELYVNVNLEFLPHSITQLSKLEALILEGCWKLRLPEDVKNWINLKQLDLSRIEDVEFLPRSITRLYNLETLILYQCKNLRELPEDTKRLINLKHLDLYGCSALTHMPKGLGELTNLQTMNTFVLGKNKGGELNELDGLTKLKGTLNITNLEFCTTVDRQTKAKFLQLKSGLQKLDLNWSHSYDKPTIGELDNVIYESILDCLQPHSNLQEMSIYNYKGVKLSNWVSSNFLGCLVTIHLRGCQKLQYLPRFDQFPNLKDILLEDLPNTESFEVKSDDSVSSSTFFPSLEELFIVKMPKLERWWKNTTSTTSPIIFLCLSRLVIHGCHLHILKFCHAPNLKLLGIGDSDDELDIVPWNFFENLTFLRLFNLRKLEYLPESWQHYKAPLQRLSLNDCENLKSLPEWIGNLTSLTELDISNCKKLTLLPEGIGNLTSLTRLDISNCEKLTLLPKGIDNLTSLTQLNISKCERLTLLPEGIGNLTSLTQFSIVYCGKLTLLPEGIRHIRNLQNLRIDHCPILKERCKKDTGEDWPKVAHIPNLQIY